MARKTSKFLIGLFVILGVLIGLVAIIWLGASKYFEKGRTYVTFFDESVQGLQVDSAVKYRGVEVGRVVKIGVAPDHKLIEVVMKVNLGGQLEHDYVAQLKAVGITGIVFIELDRQESGERIVSPSLSFTPDYPVIATKPSDIKQIVSGVHEVLQNLKQIDVKSISGQIKSTLFVLESAVENLNQVIRSIEKGVGQGKLEGILVEVRNTLSKIQDLTSAIDHELHGLNLPQTGAHLIHTTSRIEKIITSGEIEAVLREARETMRKLDQWVEGLEERSVPITQDLKVVSENLKRASGTLEMLFERIYASPSDLLFGQPPPPRRRNGH